MHLLCAVCECVCSYGCYCLKNIYIIWKCIHSDSGIPEFRILADDGRDRRHHIIIHNITLVMVRISTPLIDAWWEYFCSDKYIRTALSGQFSRGLNIPQTQTITLWSQAIRHYEWWRPSTDNVVITKNYQDAPFLIANGMFIKYPGNKHGL